MIRYIDGQLHYYERNGTDATNWKNRESAENQLITTELINIGGDGLFLLIV